MAKVMQKACKSGILVAVPFRMQNSERILCSSFDEDYAMANQIE